MSIQFYIKSEQVFIEADGKESPLKLPADAVEVVALYKYSAYLKAGQFYYYVTKFLNPKVVKITMLGLEVLNEDYAKNAKSVYFRGKEIKNADPATFTLPGVSYFAYDKNQVYANADMAEGLIVQTDVDIQSLQFLKSFNFEGNLQNHHYFFDASHLFYYDCHHIVQENHFEENYKQLTDFLKTTIPAEDAWWNWDTDYYKNLKSLGNNQFTDGKKVFYRFDPFVFYYDKYLRTPCYSRILHANPATIQPLNDYYSKDDKAVYYLQNSIPAHRASFEVIDGVYARDKNNVWFNGFVVKDADPGSFEISDNESACDKNSVYTITPASKIGPNRGYATLLLYSGGAEGTAERKVFNDFWSIYKNTVYCRGVKKESIDTATFEVLTNCGIIYARDKNHVYDGGDDPMKIIPGLDGSTFEALNSKWGKDKSSVFSFLTMSICEGIDVATFEITDDIGGAMDRNFIYRLEWADDEYMRKHRQNRYIYKEKR